jgi:hypothetical protein
MPILPKEPYTGSGLDANFYRKSRKGRRKGRKGCVVNATTFSFNPNLRELCADIVFFVVKLNLIALDWFLPRKPQREAQRTQRRRSKRNHVLIQPQPQRTLRRHCVLGGKNKPDGPGLVFTTKAAKGGAKDAKEA